MGVILATIECKTVTRFAGVARFGPEPAAWRASSGSGARQGWPALHSSELAAIAFCRLLGEPMIFDPWHRTSAPRGGPYPEWEWDTKIAELQPRLNLPGY